MKNWVYGYKDILRLFVVKLEHKLVFLHLQSMGKSLTFRGAVYEAQDIIRNHRCHDPICDTHLWKVRHELDMARIRIRQLEKELESHGIKPSRRSVLYVH